jgi:hypothetical protein
MIFVATKNGAVLDPGWLKIRIRDPGWIKSGSGIKIPDPKHYYFSYLSRDYRTGYFTFETHEPFTLSSGVNGIKGKCIISLFF